MERFSICSGNAMAIAFTEHEVLIYM